MATLLPPSKKPKFSSADTARDIANLPHVVLQFEDASSGTKTSTVNVPGAVTNKQLEILLNRLLGQEDHVPYSFSITTSNGSSPISMDLFTDVFSPGLRSTEDVLTLVYSPQAIFRVRGVSRCTGTIKGHSGVILAVQFSPKGNRLVTGAGDSSARIWDCDTATPLHTLKGHTNWVLCVSYSPDGELIATGSMDNTVRVWDHKGASLGELKSHSKWITSLAWEPLHRWEASRGARLTSASKDAGIRIWNVSLRRVVHALSGHAAGVTCVRWGGNGWLYSASQDKTIKVWNAEDGRLLHSLTSHSHRVNHMALSTDFLLRAAGSIEEARKTWAEHAAAHDEKLVSCSDDMTMFLWNVAASTSPLARMHGHQQPVNHVSFSPDGQMIASASFDSHVKLWNAKSGKLVTTLHGHVAAVYSCAWSADSRLLVSASKDTTVKLWDVVKQKLHTDLPGHGDEVYAVDWSMDGLCVASGGKDKAVRLWRH